MQSKKGKTKLWSLRFNTATVVLIPAAVAINYIGKLLAAGLKLPLWLDSIGTILGGILAGPVVGALCGAINNIIYGFMDPISFVYAITSIGIGLVAGILAYFGKFETISKAIVSSLLLAGIAVVISTPLNMIFWGGQTGNAIGDAVFAATQAGGLPVWLSSLLDEIVVDLPDKVVTGLIVFGVYRSLPKKMKLLFNPAQKVESLDE